MPLAGEGDRQVHSVARGEWPKNKTCQSGCDVRETDLPTVKRVPESFDCDLKGRQWLGRHCDLETTDREGESGCDVRETDLPTVKRVPKSFDCDLYHHEHQCQHHTSEGRCLVQRNTKTKCGGMDLKIPDGWKQMLT